MITFCKYALCFAMFYKKNTIRLLQNQSVSWLIAIFLLLSSPLSYGQETSDELVNTANQPVIKNEFEWQILLDLSLIYDPTIIAGIEQEDLSDYLLPGLLVDISYKGFYLQTNQRRSHVLLGATELGYQLFIENNWQLDLILKAYMQGFDSQSLIDHGGGDPGLLVGLKEREVTIGAAIRYSQYFEDALFRLDFAYGSSGEDENESHIGGLIIDSFYSYLLPYKNWDIYLGTGLTYFSQDIINYYIGVSPDEVIATRPEYQAEAGFRAQAEIYAQYPVSESWSFHTGITHSYYSSNVKDSPLVDTNQITQVTLGVMYVF